MAVGGGMYAEVRGSEQGGNTGGKPKFKRRQV